jgi:hypothetical protein
MPSLMFTGDKASRIMLCHSSGSFLMTWAIYDRASSGNAFGMLDVTPVVPGAVPDFIFIMALVTSSPEDG